MKRLIDTTWGLVLLGVVGFIALCVVGRLWGDLGANVLVFGTIGIVFVCVVLKEWPAGIRERRRQDDHLLLRRSGMPENYRACGNPDCPLPRPHGHPDGRTPFEVERARREQDEGNRIMKETLGKDYRPY